MKSIVFITFLFLITASLCIGQRSLTITGTILDSKTKKPLVNAGIGLKQQSNGTNSDADGSFGLVLSNPVLEDTLFVSYVGYTSYKNRLSNLDTTKQIFLLEEVATILDEVTILATRPFKFDIKKLEASFRIVKGNLYAASTETTNKWYNQFLSSLIRSGQTRLYEKYKPDISQYEGSLLAFFKGNHSQQLKSEETNYNKDYDEYPIVNISYQGAVSYCEWLTETYNNSKGKKKFKKVRFRLPELKEWQIAALGYPKFQSWDLEENTVEVRDLKYPGGEVGGLKRVIPVKGNDILYPWYHVFDYRNKGQNWRNCWLGNFKVPTGATSCYVFRPNGDGFPITGKVASYFPNDMGLFDIVGNVEEMIAEKGKACGGSWDHSPEESTIISIHPYLGPSGTVGFRVFMDVNANK
ncbi:MAG TPA: SUMF1/EgtB/PvdO family nonheme iron enzyme [Cyclobacteriaceae bacterium]|nr:SUMF1/EgtB/PvdO family nonheme iron enzyme [Cyclobacteriaceae bacterium]